MGLRRKMINLGSYRDSVIDGIKVTEVDVNCPKTRPKLKGKKLLIKWGTDAYAANFKTRQRSYFIHWAKTRLTQRAERIKDREGWRRTRVGGYSIYNVEGNEQVAEILERIDAEVRPILKEFNLSYTTTKESIAEHCWGFNRGKGRIIALNIRQKRDNMKFRKYSAIVRTMIHELAHIRHTNHHKPFKLFNAQLVDFARENEIYRPG